MTLKHKQPDFPNLEEASIRLEEEFGPDRLSPMPYCFPLDLMTETVSRKTEDFGNSIPIAGKYKYGAGQMLDYYQNYRRSRFGLTTKKGGWEALRHLEISANGSVPLMPDIALCPALTMTNAPRHLYLKAWEIYGSKVTIENQNLHAKEDHVVDDECVYMELATELLHYTRKYQSTKATARWFLNRCGVDNGATVLFIADKKKISYTCEMLCHGLRHVLESRLIDAPKLDYLYDSFPASRYSQLYGNGYGYAGLLSELEIPRDDISKRIKRGEFDLVVFGQVDRANKHLDLARKHLPANRIALIDGGDSPALFGYTGGAKVKRSLLAKLFSDKSSIIKGGHLFKREINDATVSQFSQLLCKS